MNENRSTRTFWVGVGIAASLVLVFFLWPEVAEELRPRLVEAHVAIEAGDGVARIGTTARIGSEETATLHAVLEAEDRSGEPIYYTQAERLEIGGRSVPPDRLRPWDRDESLTILWFTVEGSSPYLGIEGADDLARWRFEELFRPDWPRAWSVPAELRSRHSAHLPRTQWDDGRTFGTQRYHVRLERRNPDRPAYVEVRYRSPGAEAVEDMGEAFPTVQARLPGPLAGPSRFFGLSQLEPGPDVGAEIPARLVELARLDLAFSRAIVLRDLLASSGSGLDGLSWQITVLGDGTVRWSEQVAAGDLVRVGARITLLYRDRGQPGILDAEDLCLDFERGATIRALADVYREAGRVEWASLPQPPGAD